MHQEVRATDAPAMALNAASARARLNLSNLLGRFTFLIPALAVVPALAGAGCSAQLPDCPPGTNFDDCRPTGAVQSNNATAMNMGGSSSTSMGGTNSAPSGGSGGSGATQPPSGEGGTASTLDPPDPPDNGAAGTMSMPMVDNCPTSDKMLPGDCGCDIPDTDFDGDDVTDCLESCPDNADRTIPVAPCGCSSLTDAAACTGLRNALRNLYTFDGENTTVIEDLVGNDNATLVDLSGFVPAATVGQGQVNGRVNLDGVNTFVQLPAGRIAALTDATFEIWVAWNGGAPWARVFDFGNSVNNMGQTYLFLTAANSITQTMRVAYSVAGPGVAETTVDGLGPLAISGGVAGSSIEHVAVVVNDTAGTMQLYSNGQQLGTVALAGSLNGIQDLNNWLGRSNYAVDPMFFGSLIEFRIYDQALSGAQVSTSFQAGPGALNLQ